MADPFEIELQSLVSKVTRELAHDITRLILRRLGIEGSLRLSKGEKRVSPGAVKKALRQVSKERPRRAAAGRGRSKERPAPRTRASGEERAAVFERVAGVVGASSGLSAGEIERKSGLSRSSVGVALKALKRQGRVFMGGTKRFARYATSQSAADEASAEARGTAGE